MHRNVSSVVLMSVQVSMGRGKRKVEYACLFPLAYLSDPSASRSGEKLVFYLGRRSRVGTRVRRNAPVRLFLPI